MFPRPSLSPSTPFHSRRLAALLLALAAGPACADTVWLDNGDRLTGTIQSLDNGKLLIHTDYGGDMRIAFDHVKTLQSDTPLVIRDESMAHDYRAKLAQSDAGKVELNGVQRGADGAQPVQAAVPLDSLESVVRPHPFLNEAAVTGRVDLAANQKTASTETQDYSAALDTTVRHGLWRHEFDGRYRRSKEDHSVNTHNYGLDYTLDRFLTEKAFWQGRVMHRRDWVEDLNRQTAYGTGPGYQFWDNELGAFSLATLVNRNDYDFVDGEKDHFYSASVKWDYNRYLFAKQFEIFTNGEVGKPLSSKVDYEVESEAGVRYKLTSWAALSLKGEWDRLSAEDGGVNQRRYTLGIGVGW